MRQSMRIRRGTTGWLKLFSRQVSGGLPVREFCRTRRDQRELVSTMAARLAGSGPDGNVDHRGRGCRAVHRFRRSSDQRLKCLYFNRSGFCIWGKRLETVKFISDWRAVRTREMDRTGLKLLFEGLEGKRVRKRFSLPKRYKTSTLVRSSCYDEQHAKRGIHRLIDPR